MAATEVPKPTDERFAKAVDMIKLMAAMRGISPREELIRIVEIEAQRILFPKRGRAA